MKRPRVVLVTGASSGFGCVTRRVFEALGVQVFGTSRTASPGLLALDVDHDASVRACVAEVLRRAGHIDVLVNNAGRAMVGACEETSASEARALFETNVFGVMRMVSAVLPSMRARRSGSIVNVGSISGFIGVPFHGPYAASKHALAGYSEALRAEVAALGIRVALIEPAAHRTGITMAHPALPIDVYAGGRAAVEGIIGAQIARGDGPESVAAAIVRAASGARFRHRVGSKAALAAFARSLPEALFELVVRREFPIPRPPFSESGAAPRLPGA